MIIVQHTHYGHHSMESSSKTLISPSS
uniref:Uncharacterized protein n=1 Tax=Arundo donax TaxID=35708 RepID=A0A0A9F9K6_ARUDO